MKLELDNIPTSGNTRTSVKNINMNTCLKTQTYKYLYIVNDTNNKQVLIRLKYNGDQNLNVDVRLNIKNSKIIYYIVFECKPP